MGSKFLVPNRSLHQDNLEGGQLMKLLDERQTLKFVANEQLDSASGTKSCMASYPRYRRFAAIHGSSIIRCGFAEWPSFVQWRRAIIPAKEISKCQSRKLRKTYMRKTCVLA